MAHWGFKTALWERQWKPNLTTGPWNSDLVFFRMYIHYSRILGLDTFHCLVAG